MLDRRSEALRDDKIVPSTIACMPYAFWSATDWYPPFPKSPPASGYAYIPQPISQALPSGSRVTLDRVS